MPGFNLVEDDCTTNRMWSKVMEMIGDSRNSGHAVDSSDGPCVMIVDDEDDIRAMIRFALELKGYHVVEARDGRDALRQLHEGLRPGLILLDLMMPGMNGWDFRTEQVRSAELAKIPILVFTGEGCRSFCAGSTTGQAPSLPTPPSGICGAQNIPASRPLDAPSSRRRSAPASGPRSIPEVSYRKTRWGASLSRSYPAQQK